ncbi:hypothetical protein WDW89_06350 [Deltaproteobacteria bacterium TL4]
MTAEESSQVSQPALVSLSGGQFSEILRLTDSAISAGELQTSWKQLKQQIDTFILKTEQIDLNSLVNEVLLLEILAFPIAEDYKRPISGPEWKALEAQITELQSQTEEFHKSARQLGKNKPEIFLTISPLFNQLFQLSYELQKIWNDFKKTWKVFLAKQKSLDAKKHPQADRRSAKTVPPESSASEEKAETVEEEELVPPMFNRLRWQVSLQCFKLLQAELTYQWQLNKAAEATQSDTEFTLHPVIPLLVEAVRDVYRRTQGFELLNKIKLVQQRNEQLIQQLQLFYGEEPIIFKEMLKESFQLMRDDRIHHPASRKSAPTLTFKNFIRLMGALMLLALLFLGSFIASNTSEQKQVQRDGNLFSRLPQGKTLYPSEEAMEKQRGEEKQLYQFLADLNLEINVYPFDEQLQRLANSTPPETEGLLQEITRQMGRIPFVFTDAKTFFLVWNDRIQKFASFKEIKKVTQKLARQSHRLLGTMKDLATEISQYELELATEIVEGEPGYAVVLKDPENHVVGRIYMVDEYFHLQWKNSQTPQRFSSSAELADAIMAQE